MKEEPFLVKNGRYKGKVGFLLKSSSRYACLLFKEEQLQEWIEWINLTKPSFRDFIREANRANLQTSY